MTSENLAASASPSRKLSLRGQDQKPLSATGDVAATAIEYVLQRRASKRRGLPVAPLPASLRRTAVSGTQHGRRAAPELSWLSVGAGVLGAAAALLVAIGLLGREASAPPIQRHAVSGTLTLRGRPLADSVVEFHRLDAAGSPVETAFTDTSGHFAIGDIAGTGVPSGEYGVVIRGRRRVVRRGEVFFDHVPLPAHYATPDASPLKASVSGPIARLSLAIVP